MTSFPNPSRSALRQARLELFWAAAYLIGAVVICVLYVLALLLA